MVKKRLGFKWSGFWMGSEIQKPNHLKSTNGGHFFKNYLNFGQKCLDFVRSGFQMVGAMAVAVTIAWPFEKPDHLKSDLQKVLLSNGRISNPLIIHWSEGVRTAGHSLQRTGWSECRMSYYFRSLVGIYRRFSSRSRVYGGLVIPK